MKIKILLFAIIIALFSSCEKEQIETNLEKEILVFSSFEEYHNTVQKTNAMNEVELALFEDSIGFVSFGRKCDEIYNSINPDEFKSIDEIKSFVMKNNEFMELISDYTKDLYCLPKEFNNNSRYVLNKDKMYIIGDIAFKLIENSLVSTKVKNIEALKETNSIENAFGRPIFEIQKLNSSAPYKKHTIEDHNDVGNFRLKLFIQTELFHYTIPGISWQTKRETEYKITNYKKTLGIYFTKKILTDYEILLRSSDSKSQIENLVTTNGMNHNVYDSVISESFKMLLAETITWDYPPYFIYYYAYAKNNEGCEMEFGPGSTY